MALNGGLFEVAVEGTGRATGGKLNQELNYSAVGPKQMRRQSAWADMPSIRDP